MYLWLEAVASSIVVSLASLICLALLPWVSGHKAVRSAPASEKLTHALMAFAAGAMLGEACLHQLPEAFQSAQGQHHAHHDHEHTHEGQMAGLQIFLGILLFFLIESFVHRLSAPHHHVHDSSSHPALSAESSHPSSTSQPGTGHTVPSSNEPGSQSDTARRRQRPASSPNQDPSMDLGLPDSRNPIGGDPFKGARRRWYSWMLLPEGTHPMAYLNLLADGVHNFTDGIALASAFLSGGHMAGWRRMLIVLMHELPQEIGDFGVLVSAGLTPRQALGWNLVSAGTAVLGAALVPLVGVLVPGLMGSENSGTAWLSALEAITAGGFLWISVGDVLPVLASKPDVMRSVGSVVAGLACCLLFEQLVH